METFDRITGDPEVMGGKPCIRGMRVTVGMIVGQVGAGRTDRQYPAADRQQLAVAAVGAGVEDGHPRHCGGPFERADRERRRVQLPAAQAMLCGGRERVMVVVPGLAE